MFTPGMGLAVKFLNGHVTQTTPLSGEIFTPVWDLL